uniref:INO80 complex subunit F domain-containing protein n=1 Tax=Megaselia scalaris TaxID=36166 RepID=T1GLP4_MEGSC
MISSEENYKYKQFVEQLYLKSQEIQMENERYAYRILKVKKLIKKRSKEVALIKKRLDRYNDDWRNVPMELPPRQLKRGPKPKPKIPGEQPKPRKNKQLRK